MTALYRVGSPGGGARCLRRRSPRARRWTRSRAGAGAAAAPEGDPRARRRPPRASPTAAPVRRAAASARRSWGSCWHSRPRSRLRRCSGTATSPAPRLVAAQTTGAVVAFDARSGALRRRISAGRTPSSIAVHGGAAWVVDADAQTVLRLSVASRVVETFSTGATPTDVAADAGSVWVANGRPLEDAQFVGPVATAVARLDDDDRHRARRDRAPAGAAAPSRTCVENHVAAKEGAVWAVTPDFAVVRIDAATGAITARSQGRARRRGRRGPRRRLGARRRRRRGAARRTLRSAARARERAGVLRRCDRRRFRRRLGDVAGGRDALEGRRRLQTDGRRDRARPGVAGRRSREGRRLGREPACRHRRPGRDRVRGGRADARSGRHPAVDRRRRRHPLGRARRRPRRRRRSRSPGSGRCRPRRASACSRARAMPTSSSSPTSRCREERGAPPRRWRRRSRSSCASGASAPARFKVAYQSCDDSVARTGLFDEAKCAANARAYAREPRRRRGDRHRATRRARVAAVPELNRAPGGPLAMISPFNSFVGLTRAGAGRRPLAARRPLPDRPPELRARVPDGRPAGRRARAAWHATAAAGACIVLDDGDPGYGALMATGFETAAGRLGLEVVGRDSWDPRARQLCGARSPDRAFRGGGGVRRRPAGHERAVGSSATCGPA